MNIFCVYGVYSNGRSVVCGAFLRLGKAYEDCIKRRAKRDQYVKAQPEVEDLVFSYFEVKVVLIEHSPFSHRARISICQAVVEDGEYKVFNSIKAFYTSQDAAYFLETLGEVIKSHTGCKLAVVETELNRE